MFYTWPSYLQEPAQNRASLTQLYSVLNVLLHEQLACLVNLYKEDTVMILSFRTDRPGQTV